VRDVLVRTATPLATYDEFEVGAGLANVYAAVDLAQNPSKAYGNFGFTGKGLALTASERAATTARSTALFTSATHEIDVPANARFVFVQLDWGAAAGEDEAVVDNTRHRRERPAPERYAQRSDGRERRRHKRRGTLRRARGRQARIPRGGQVHRRSLRELRRGRGRRAALLRQRHHYMFDPAQVADATALDASTRAGVYRLVYDRVMSADGGAFRPDDVLTRVELARALMLGARVPQYIPNRASFTDIAVGSPESLFAESVRREGVLGVSGTTFVPTAPVNRLDAAVALVRALRLDKDARAKAGTTVTSGGTALTDNADIPSAMRGYVQIALDHGLLQAYPAEVRQIAPGQFVAVPGPRFEPARTIKRGEFVSPRC
jgi:hypothetical protein